MSQATVLGSLLVQLGMDSAQFERAATKAQSKTSAIAKTFDVTAKDVYSASQRMGMSVTQFGNTMNALQARVNPAVTALASYRQEMGVLRQALRLGIITQVQFRGEVQKAMTAYRAAGTGVVQSSGAMQAGMQQLNYQIGDMATMWAMGAKPQQIFVSQAAQTVQAISLLTGGAGKFATFMRGPWGMALQAGVIVLSSLLPVLLKTDSAMKEVEQASNALGDAQSVLGEMFDLTTGKLEKQNTMLRLNAQTMAYNLRMQAATEKANYEKTLGTFAQGQLGLSMGQKALGALGVPVGAAMQRENAVRAVASDLNSGKINSEAAFRRAEKLDFDGLGVSRDEFLGAIRDGVSFPGKQKISDEILKTLNSGVLSPMFREDGKKKRTPKSKDQDKIAARYDEDMNRLQAERAQLEADYTQTIESRYQANIVEIDNDLASFKANTLANKDIGKERQQALILEATKNADLRKQIAENDRDDALANKASAILQQDLQLQIDQVQLRGQLAVTIKDQKAAALEMLDLQDRLRIAELDRIMATEAAGSAAWDNARVEKQSIQSTRGQREELVNRQNMSPMERYRFNLQSSVADINSAMENIQVDAIDGLTNGIAAAIAGTQKLGDVFKNVAQSIIADLIRIQIQKALVGTLGKVLGSVGGLSGVTALGNAGGGFGGSADFRHRSTSLDALLGAWFGPGFPT